jgi:hypothetical protein
VIWNLLQSQFMQQTIALAAVLLAVIGTMSGDAWIESYCRQSTGTAWSSERTWRDSRNLAFLVFTMASVVESYWTDLRRWPRCERSSSSSGEASTPQSNRSACGSGRRCGISLPNFWPAARLFPGGVPTDHRSQPAAWLPRNGPDGAYARARRISLPARVLSAVGEADGSGGCMFGVVANHCRGRTQLSYAKCRRSDNFAGPAESASSYQRGSTRSYLLGIGLRCFSALPRDPASATVQGNKLGRSNLIRVCDCSDALRSTRKRFNAWSVGFCAPFPRLAPA